MSRRPAAGRALAGCAVVTLLVALAACSTAPKSSPSSRPSGSSSGKYYLDDGPGNAEPADLAAIPDAKPRREPILPRTTRPYVVFGRTYTPRSELVPYREEGVASWYGRKFHGQRTSSGEVYDMYGMTAAHPTLPIPSYVRVTSVANGRSVVVRVNDRGPFLNNRLIDLSWTAAAKLGYVNAGHARVVVEQITRFDGDDGMPVRVPDNLATATPATPAAASSSNVALPSATASTAPSPALTTAQAATSIAAASSTSDNEVDPGISAASSRAIEAIVNAAASVPAAADSGAGAASSAAADGHYLQLAAYGSRDGAEAARAMLAHRADWIAPYVQVRLDGGLYKLRAGPYPLREHAEQAVERLRMTTELKPIMVPR